MNREDFSYVTSFENNHYCKPQPKFFEEILIDIKKKPEECMMVGNDAQEDMVAKMVGIQTYLITNHLIHRKDKPLVADITGDYADFLLYVQSLPTVN
jgi:FMN phosphatase YigB (HAD superfamily)